MKKLWIILIIASLAFGGRFGMGIAGGSQYDKDYKTISPESLKNMFYGAEFYIQAEALPNVFLEPSITYFNNPTISSSAAGVGLGINIQPRLGGFPIAPFFGVEGTLLLYNDLDVAEAVKSGQLNTYIETSRPKLAGAAFAGISLFLGKSISLDCHYRYQGLSRQFGVEMVWAGLSYYFNW
jgi:hypothetical protein